MLAIIDFERMKSDFLTPYIDKQDSNLAQNHLGTHLGCAVITAVEEYIVGTLQINSQNYCGFGESMDRFLGHLNECRTNVKGESA